MLCMDIISQYYFLQLKTLNFSFPPGALQNRFSQGGTKLLHCRTEYRVQILSTPWLITECGVHLPTMFWTTGLQQATYLHVTINDWPLPPSWLWNVPTLNSWADEGTGLYQNHLCTLATGIFKGNKRLRKWPRGFRARVNKWSPLWGTKRCCLERLRVREGGGRKEERERGVQILISGEPATHGLVRLKEGQGLHLQPKSPLWHSLLSLPFKILYPQRMPTIAIIILHIMRICQLVSLTDFSFVCVPIWDESWLRVVRHRA